MNRTKNRKSKAAAKGSDAQPGASRGKNAKSQAGPSKQRPKTTRKSSPRKPHYCPFCGKLLADLMKHLRWIHRNEPRVQEAEKLPFGSHERRWAWKVLFRQGDYQHSRAVLSGKEGGRVTFVYKRSETTKGKSINCPFCYGRLKGAYMRKHLKLCRPGVTIKWRVRSTPYRATDDNFYEAVLTRLKNNLGLRIMDDPFLFTYGKDIWQEMGYRRVKEIRDRMRFAVGLEDDLKKVRGEEEKLSNLFDASEVDAFAEAIKIGCGFENGPKGLTFRAPTKVFKLIRLVKELADFKRREYLKYNDEQAAAAVDRFQNLFMASSGMKLKTLARTSISARSKRMPIPSAQIVRLFYEYLVAETPLLVATLQGNVWFKPWRWLARNLLARIIVFNRRRRGAVDRLTLESYLAGKTLAEKARDDLIAVNDPKERDLLASYKVVDLVHKYGRSVAIFFDQDVQKALDVLNSLREKAGIGSDNPYLFACVYYSRQQLRGDEAILFYKRKILGMRQSKITSTSLRKQGATVAQALRMSGKDLIDLSSHLGHSVGVHMHHYRVKEKPCSLLDSLKILRTLAGHSVTDAGPPSTRPPKRKTRRRRKGK